MTNLDFYEIDRLKHSGGSGEHAGIEHTACCGDDLATTAMDGISVQCHVMDVKPHATHILLAQNSLCKNKAQSQSSSAIEKNDKEQLCECRSHAPKERPGVVYCTRREVLLWS